MSLIMRKRLLQFLDVKLMLNLNIYIHLIWT